jgi:hypothetical protein
MIKITFMKNKNVIKVDYVKDYYVIAFNNIVKVEKDKEKVLNEIEKLLSIFA